MNENIISIKEAMRRIEPCGAKRQPTINGYCMRSEIPSIRKGDRWYIEETYIDKAVLWWNGITTTEEILFNNPKYKELSEYDQKQCFRKVSEQTSKFLIEENKYSILSLIHI